MDEDFVFFIDIVPAPKTVPGAEKALKYSMNECEA